MALLTLEGKFDSSDAVIFPEAFARFENLLEKDRIRLFCGAVDLERGQPSLQVDHVSEVEDAVRHFGTCIEILLEDRGESEAARLESVSELSQLLRDSSQESVEGHRVEPLVRLDVEGARVTLRTRRYTLVPTTSLISRLVNLVGPDCIRVVGGHVPPAPPRLKRGRPRRAD